MDQSIRSACIYAKWPLYIFLPFHVDKTGPNRCMDTHTNSERVQKPKVKLDAGGRSVDWRVSAPVHEISIKQRRAEGCRHSFTVFSFVRSFIWNVSHILSAPAEMG